MDESYRNDDGGTVVRPDSIPATNPGRWVRLYSGAINVRWFGAGLGAADDAPLVQQAIDTAIHGVSGNSAFGSTVYFPSGTYNVGQPIHLETSDPAYQGWISVRVTGDGKFNTHLRLTGPYSTAFVFGGLSQSAHPNGPGVRLRHCEISNLSISQIGDKQRLEGAILFPGGGIGFLVMNVSMYGVWRGITCIGTTDSVTWRTKIQNVHMEGVLNAGLYAGFAINWAVSNLYVGCRDYSPNPPPHGTAGVWLDTRTEGWMFTVMETGGFDTGLRMASSSDERPPDTHQFVQCNFDAGGRACIWLTNSHRCRFQGCYASSANATITGVIVLDSADVYGLENARGVRSAGRSCAGSRNNEHLRRVERVAMRVHVVGREHVNHFVECHEHVGEHQLAVYPKPPEESLAMLGVRRQVQNGELIEDRRGPRSASTLI